MPINPDGTPNETYQLDTYTEAYGMLVAVGDGTSPEVFHIIAGVADIDGPTSSMTINDKTTHSTGSRYRGKAVGLRDAGQLKFAVHYDPANPSHSDTSPFGLGYIFLNGLRRRWMMVAPDPSHTARWFYGYISEFAESYPVEGSMDRNTTIEIDGALNPGRAA